VQGRGRKRDAASSRRGREKERGSSLHQISGVFGIKKFLDFWEKIKGGERGMNRGRASKKSDP